MADVATAIESWSTTASSNSPSDSTSIGAGLADNFQQIQATVRAAFASKGADIASATTTDLGAVAGHQHDITGTTTITGFGTVAAGIWKIIKFEGALTLTHNATSLILPGGANITTADGDIALAVSEGSGNWRVSFYTRASVKPANAGTISSTFTFDGGGGTSVAKGLTWQRHGDFVDLHIPAVAATSGTGSSSLVADTALPASVRPGTSAQYQLSAVALNNNSAPTAPGLISVTTAGLIVINRDGAGTAFTNSSTCGTSTGTTIRYFVGSGS